MATTMIVRLSRDGRITIPAAFRRALAIEPDAHLMITLDNGVVYITPLRSEIGAPGSSWVRDFYDYFAPVRAEIAAAGYTEDEVNADIDAAIRAVRTERR